MIDFKKPYDRIDFETFLKWFIPDTVIKTEEIIPNRTYSLIRKITKIGKSEALDLNLYELEHENEHDPRVTLSKESFALIKDYGVHRALIIFKNKKSLNYRFSLITFGSKWESGTKIEKEFSNPRRFSFFLGPDAKVNTPTKFLISKDKIMDFNDLKKRFSIEVVNKEFYKEISLLFIKLVGGTINIGKKKTDFKSLLKLPSIIDKSQACLEFAVRLIGRILFCWFLREKKSQVGLSLIPKELLSLEAVKSNENFYHTILEPIFFEVLNKPVKSRIDDFSKNSFSSVPYLNGGLFYPQNDDFYKRNNGDYQSQYRNTLVIPDNWFKDFFKILETYNFTIDENTSYDEELSIDPEMLGRIFENLLAEINPETGESARKSTGSYYTPRVIVDYMVDESILLYLKQQTKVKENKLKAMITYDLVDDSNFTYSLEEKEQIINSLESLKLLDPACGSGAFPIGALQKIVFILQQIDPDGKLWFKKVRSLV